MQTKDLLQLPQIFLLDILIFSEKNIAKAMIPMFSMPREKRKDPITIQELMEGMSETDRKVMNFFFSGRDAFEKVMANNLISCTDSKFGIC